MADETVIEGHRYRGRFSADRKQREVERGSGYNEYLAEVYWFEGVGMVSDNQTGQIQRFLLRTSAREDARKSALLEEMIMIKRQDGWAVDGLQVIDQPAIYDLILNGMYEDALEGEKTEIIPKVFPRAQSYEGLLEMGLVAEEGSGQIMLPLVR